MQRADFSRICNREMFTCISSNRVQPLRPQACIGRDAKKSNFLAVWTGGSFLITKWHTAIPILWWFIFIHGKKGTLYNHALNYTTRSSVFFSARILTLLVFMYSYRGLPSHPPLWIRCMACSWTGMAELFYTYSYLVHEQKTPEEKTKPAHFIAGKFQWKPKQ